MTIEQEARDLLNASVEDKGRDSPYYFRSDNRRNRPEIEAVCRALEQRNAERQAHTDFRQRVSDEAERILAIKNYEALYVNCTALRQFVIPKPVDPLVEALATVPPIKGESYRDYAERLRAACIKHGIPIPDKREEG